MIKAEQIYQATDDGLDIIIALYPDANECVQKYCTGTPKKHFARANGLFAMSGSISVLITPMVTTAVFVAGGLTPVLLIDLGTFAVAERAATEGRNPRTGEKIAIPASKQPKFKAGKNLKDALN